MNESFAIQGYTMTDKIMCFISGDEIYQTDYLGQKRLIGKTSAAYSELEQTTTEYYNKLVELGVIVPEKTQEELIAQMQSSMLEMSKVISGLTEELKELKNNGCERDTSNAGQDVP